MLRGEKEAHDQQRMLKHLAIMREQHLHLSTKASTLEQEKKMLADRLEAERIAQERAAETNEKLQKEIKRLARPERQREEEEVSGCFQL